MSSHNNSDSEDSMSNGHNLQEAGLSLSNNEGSESSTNINIAKANIEFNFDVVSPLNECVTKHANKLCIFDLHEKLKCSDQYDIGGTYCNVNESWKPQVWFYCSTSLCPGRKYLLNIFVYRHNMGSFEIGISDGNLISKEIKIKTQTYLSLTTSLIYKTFTSIQVGQSHHIKSYSFNSEDLTLLSNNNLYIPIEINMDPKHKLDKEVLFRLKTNHDSMDIFKRQENTDFMVISESGTKYAAHKAVLAAHSLVLRNELRQSNSDSLLIKISDDVMELLLEFFYCNTIKDIKKHDSCKLLELADKFEIKNLFKEAERAMLLNINIDNAVDIAVISEKYKLNDVQKSVYDFIKKNTEIFKTQSWKKLNDVTVAKKLISEVFSDFTVYIKN